jgi:hypothetical protein
MASGGVNAVNFKEGARSEYLAHYILSAIGPSWPIPRPEDIGLDLIGNIGIPVEGENKGRLVNAGPGYVAQIKSTKKDIVYDGPYAFHWLCGLQMPLFLVVADKDKQEILVYSTWAIHRAILKCAAERIPVVPQTVSFVIDAPILELEVNTDCPGKEYARVPTGAPILRIRASEVEDPDRLMLFRAVFGAWVECESYNYAVRSAKLPAFAYFVQWKENCSPTEAKMEMYYSPGQFNDALDLMAWASHPLHSYLVALKDKGDANAGRDLDISLSFWRHFVDRIRPESIRAETEKTLRENPPPGA